MLNIEKKIEEIRRQPEHIRLRYIYSLVAISMFFIVLLWFFSFFAGGTQEDAAAKLKNQAILNDFETQKKSLQDISKDAKNSIDDLNKTISPKTNTPTIDQQAVPGNDVIPTNNKPRINSAPADPSNLSN
jgi:hypothetical protein